MKLKFLSIILITMPLSSCVLDNKNDELRNSSQEDNGNKDDYEVEDCDFEEDETKKYKTVHFVESCNAGDEYTYLDGVYHGVFKSKMGVNDVHEGTGIIFRLEEDKIEEIEFTSLYFQNGSGDRYGEYYTYLGNNPDTTTLINEIDAFEEMLDYFEDKDINELLSGFDDESLDSYTGATGRKFPYMFIGNQTAWSTSGSINLALENVLSLTEFELIEEGKDDYSNYN